MASAPNELAAHGAPDGGGVVPEAFDRGGTESVFPEGSTFVALPPSFGFTTIANLRLTEGKAMDSVVLPEAQDVDGTGSLTYGLQPALPAGLTFESGTRKLSGVPTGLMAATDYTYTATDANGSTAVLVFRIEVVGPTRFPGSYRELDPQIFEVGRSVHFNLPEAWIADYGLPHEERDRPQYKLEPALPDGLRFVNELYRQVDNNNRTRKRNRLSIQGTPTARADTVEYTFSARLNALRDTIRFQIKVDHIPEFAFAIDGTGLQWRTGRAASVTLPTAMGWGTMTYSLDEVTVPTNLTGVATAGLPPGMSYSTAARRISGTPSQAGQFVVTHTATDPEGVSNSQAVVMHVQDPNRMSFEGMAIPPQTYVRGFAIDTLYLPDPGGNYTNTCTFSGSLPSGLNHDGIHIAGTPTAVTPVRTFTWRCTDAFGQSASLNFTIQVIESSGGSISMQSAAVAPQNYAVNQALTGVTLPPATGGSGPITYSLAPDLPDGLDFDGQSRSISGAPSSVTPAKTYTYTATDQSNQIASLAFQLEVQATDAVPTFGNATIADQWFVTDHQIPDLPLPVASDGNGTLVYHFSPALPDGITFDMVGMQLRGTATADLPQTEYTFTATDADGDTATLTFSLKVSANSLPQFSASAITKLTFVEDQEHAGTALPVANGGNGTLTYSLSPALPDGLTFDEAAHVISGTPTVIFPAADFTLVATDDDGDAASAVFPLEVAAWSRVRILHNAEATGFDLYMDGTQFADDLEHESGTAFGVVGAGDRTLEVVAADATDQSDPLFSANLALASHGYQTVMIYHDGVALQQASLANEHEVVPPAGRMQLVVGHGANGLGRADVRVLDARDNTTILHYLASELTLGSWSAHVSVIPDVHNVEVVDASGQHAVYRFDLSGYEDQVVVLMLSDALSGSGLVAVTPTGDAILPHVVTAGDAQETIPEAPLVLDGNFPNPFVADTRIQFQLGLAAQVGVRVTDLLGRTVLETPAMAYTAGRDRGVDLAVNHLASGVYMYLLQAVTESGVHRASGQFIVAK